jgi:hypothetical protein
MIREVALPNGRASDTASTGNRLELSIALGVSGTGRAAFLPASNRYFLILQRRIE